MIDLARDNAAYQLCVCVCVCAYTDKLGGWLAKLCQLTTCSNCNLGNETRDRLAVLKINLLNWFRVASGVFLLLLWSLF